MSGLKLNQIPDVLAQLNGKGHDVQLSDLIPKAAGWHPLMALRWRLGYNTSDTARLIKVVSRQCIGKVERWEVLPRLDTAYAILDWARLVDPDGGHTLETLFPRRTES